MIKVAPSLLAADLLRIGEEIASVRASGADWLHFDVMDGRFVPNISFGPALLRACAATGVFCDAHLMIAEPDRYIDAFAAAGAGAVTVHAEACADLRRTLGRIRAAGCLSGVALNPDTAPDCLRGVLDAADLVLVMTVVPGFGGQRFIPAAAEKIGRVRELIAEAGMGTLIGVDGGIDEKTAPECLRRGADILAAGTAFFRAPDRAAFVRALRGA